MTDSPSESRVTHPLHHDDVMLEFSEDSTPDSWWINLQLLYPDNTGEHLAEVGMTDVEVMDLAHDLMAMVINGRVKFSVEAAVQERYEEEIEKARHDMPAELFNDFAEFLLARPSDPKSLFLLERLRNRYGASTRRQYGLDQPDDAGKAAVAERLRHLPGRDDPKFWQTEHDKNL